MKKLIVIVFIVISINALGQQVDNRVLDKNARAALEEFRKSLIELNNNKEATKDEDLTLNFIKQTACLQSFKEKIGNDVITKALNDLSPDPALESKMKNLMGNQEFQLKLMAIAVEVKKNPSQLCTFKMDENTPDMLAKKNEKETFVKSYKSILELKKTIHPLFVKLIIDLEKKKKSYMSGMKFPVELEEGNFEKNFNKVFEFQVKFVEAKSLEIMTLLPSHCIEDIKKIFNKICIGKPSYAPIKGQVTKYLLCADENQDKIDKSCGYQTTFSIE